MARLEFCDKHNMVAYLVKSESSEGFDEIIDFITLSHIYYALTKNPIISVSLIEQFWETAILSTTEEGLQAISATIDGHEKLITEDSLRRHLKLEDAKGISSLSNEEIIKHLAHIGSKKTTWDQFSSNIATSIICLATSRRFNFSKFIFKAMVKNLDSPHKFLLYPKFIQLLLNKQQRLLLPHTRTYPTPTLTSKLFSNMRRSSMGITSSPSLSQQPTRSLPLPEPVQPTHEAEETAFMPHDSPLYAVHSHGSAKDPTISLVQNKGVSWIPQEEEVHEKSSDETKVLVQEETPIEIIEEHGSGEKGEMEISTANIQVSTATPPKVSTVVPHVYTRRSAKDKGKAIMEETATPKKVKKRTQVQLSMDEELARKMEEEERIRFNAEQEARALQEKEEERLNLEAVREMQRQLDQRQEVPTQPTQSQGIDWNDPSVLRVWDHVNTFIPIGSKVEIDSSKPSEKETSKIVEEGKVEKEDVKPEPVLIKKKAVGFRRKTLARRRESDKQGQDNSKRQKKEKETADYEEENNELRMWLIVVPDEEEFVDPEILHTRFPIVDWESQSLYSMHVYKIIRADGNTSYHKTFESMLKSFDRHDLEVLHRLVMERFQDNTPEGYNLMLWGDLKILVDPKQDDDIWKNQNQWKIISWKLYETCRVHTLMVDGTLMTIHMFVEKKYPLTKETLQKMLNWKLEAEAESSMAFELLKFIKTQIEEQ
ncbi:hypothetical protein Tco_0006610 [Tanacetum coccineum]